jgi:hypothetical protein
MARNKKWTDEQVEAEIARLKGSEFVKLAKKEKQIKERRRQYMWTLQYMETRGKQLASNGVTFENIEEKLFGEEAERANNEHAE